MKRGYKKIAVISIKEDRYLTAKFDHTHFLTFNQKMRSNPFFENYVKKSDNNTKERQVVTG